jgi:hypothetical protein
MRRFLKVPAVLAVLLIILTGSPVLAAQLSHHEQKAGAYHHQTFAKCVAGESCVSRGSGGNTTHDDWPANMILD